MRIADRLVPALLRDVADFRHLWTGQTISVFGDEINRIALPLVAVLVPVGAFVGGVLGTALGVREALFVTAVAASLGVLWLIGSNLLRIRELPDVAVLQGSTAAAPD